MSDKLPDTKMDTLKAQMAARARLSNPDGPPRFVLGVCSPRVNEAGQIVQPPIDEEEPDHALIGLGPNQQRLERVPGESVEAFTARCLEKIPANQPCFWLLYRAATGTVH